MAVEENNKIVSNTLIYGILWILLNNFIMTIQSATIKTLASYLPKHQIIFIYKFAVLLCVIPWVLYKGIDKLKTKKIHLHFIRAALSLTGAMLFIHGLVQLKIAEAMAIAFTEPLFIGVLAIILLKEDYNRITVISLITGFIGALIVIKPGTNSFSSGALWVIAASIIWAFDGLIIKRLGKTERSIQYVFYVSLFSTIFAAPFAIKEWKSIPHGINIKLFNIVNNPIKPEFILFTLAIYYFIHLLAVFRAFRNANVSMLAPFDFSRLIMSSLIGTLLFGEEIEQRVILGSIIIIASSAQIIWNKEYDKGK